MTVALGRGACGGHLTLLFTVDDQAEDPNFQGSLGAGICVSDGVEAIARGQEGAYSLSVRFLSGEGDSNMYQQVLDLLCEEIPQISELNWEIAIKMTLPPSQGFGMSAAGAIAAACAFQRAIGQPHEESQRRAYSIAHRVERMNSTGLGDVTALSAGGVERRLIPGSPYSGSNLVNGPGVAEGWFESTPIVLAWRENPGRHTSEYIDNAKWKKLITDSGTEQMNILSEGVWDSSRWNELIECAESFSTDSQLASDASRSSLIEAGKNAARRVGIGGDVAVLLCMLGESIAIVPRQLGRAESLDSMITELGNEGLQALVTSVGIIS